MILAWKNLFQKVLNFSALQLENASLKGKLVFNEF